MVALFIATRFGALIDRLGGVGVEVLIAEKNEWLG